MVRSRKELSIFLSKLKVFDKPKPNLEQYPSDGNVAGELLWKTVLNGDIEDKEIVDMGCGTGILGIGALILGAKSVEFIDIDPSVQKILEDNIKFAEEYFDESLEGKWTFSGKDVTNQQFVRNDEIVVLMNPPFGTRKKHADRGFLVAGFKMAPVIYTMHKTSTEGFVAAFCRDENIQITWQEQTSFPLKNTMQTHKKKIERIEVTLYRLEKA